MAEQIKFFNDDADLIYKTLLSRTEGILNEALYPGDKRRIFLEAVALVLASMFAEANTQGLQLFLRYASGAYLDLHGEEHECARIAGDYAQTIIRFKLKKALDYNVIIPRGTRCAVDGHYFATDEKALIPAGELTIDVNATATEKGSELNGYVAGAINTLVDSVNGIESVENTIATYGGDDVESDEDYRERIRNAGLKYAAGTEKQYISLAKSANTIISDVRVKNDHEAGTVELIVLCNGGKVPSDAILNEVLGVCAKSNNRPLNDKVSVIAPNVIDYDIELEIFSKIGKKGEVIQWVEGKGQEENYKDGCVEKYINWQCEKLGRDISPDELHGFCMEGKNTDGSRLVKRMIITKPEFTKLNDYEIARWSGNISIKYKEEED